MNICKKMMACGYGQSSQFQPHSMWNSMWNEQLEFILFQPTPRGKLEWKMLKGTYSASKRTGYRIAFLIQLRPIRFLF